MEKCELKGDYYECKLDEIVHKKFFGVDIEEC